MDNQIKNCPDLTDRDIDLLYQVEAGLPLVADVSRADILLCCRLSNKRALVLRHVEPESISSLYRKNATGRTFTFEEQPLLFRTLRSGNGGRRQKQIISSGAPVIQNVISIKNAVGKPIAVLLIEMNMIEHERHRRRDRNFRRAVHWLQLMGARGELENPEELRRFGPYDGIYFIGRDRRIVYMSGIASNLFRTIGLFNDMRGRDVSALEESDAQLVTHAFDAHRCVEMRTEADDGRIWVRGAIPLYMPPASWPKRGWVALMNRLHVDRRSAYSPSNSSGQSVDGVLVLMHNATEIVQRQRELNVKSAIIQEVHHRVKNNLQTIAAILRIQARRCTNEETRVNLTEAVNRILSMSVIHEFLSQDEHRPINVREVCQRIAAQVAQVVLEPEQQIAIDVTGPNIRLPAGQATPTALVVNELILNAVEHGLSGRREGTIEIRLRDLGNNVEIAILDDGHGLPDDFVPNEHSSLGLQIVQTLVTDDLKGTLRMEPVGVAATAVATAPGQPPADAPALESDSAESTASDVDFRTQAIVLFPKRALHAD